MVLIIFIKNISQYLLDKTPLQYNSKLLFIKWGSLMGFQWMLHCKLHSAKYFKNFFLSKVVYIGLSETQ